MVKVSQAAAVLAAASLPVVAFASSASAGVTVSRLAVSQGSSTVTSMSIDASKGPVQVSVTLDSHCFAAYGNGQTYGIAAVSGNPSVVTVSPASVSGLHCGDAKTFTLTGVGNGSTTVTFDPVAAAPGLQKKLGNVVVPVTVTGADTTVNDGGKPPAHKRPGAPAVANAYLNDAGLLAACKTQFASSGHHWHGAYIKAIARWAAVNKLSRTKENRSLYPTDGDWLRFVEKHVDGVCGYTPPAAT